MKKLGGAVLGMALLSLLVAAGALAGQPAPLHSDNLTSPLQQKQQILRQKAMAMQATGVIPANTKVGRVAKGQYVQLQQTGHSNIFVILAEFGNATMYGGTPGPLRNQIPVPD